jgi:hypothetical protein
MRVALACVLFVAAAVGGSAASAVAATPAVPAGFLGVNVNGPLDDPAFDLAAEAARMRADGVRAWRVELAWDQVEPVHGTFDFAATDRKVLAAAANGLEVLGLAVRAPAWANGGSMDPFVPPTDPAAFGRYLTALVARYGPTGTLWAEHPEVPPRPVRAWEVWNEPNIAVYFRTQPFMRPYARLFRAASSAIRAADGGATVLLAGMANFSWRDLARLLDTERGLRFDGAAVHPFTGKPSGTVEIVRRNRRVLDDHGRKAKPLWLTELTWSSAKGRKTPLTKGWETSEGGQADRLRQVYRVLAAARKRLRVTRVFWYTWASRDDGSQNSFEYSGLRSTRGGTTLVDKPALAAFRVIARR